MDACVKITTGQLMLALAGLFLLNLLLRVFYIRYDFVNGDEGVRALTAVRMLEGARLYADVVTDKPPGASLFYAAVFIMFGRSMKTVHLAATVWNFGTSLMVYLIAARFYGKRIGLLAALLFVYFSTNYFTQDMMAANTELLMALPYSAAFYFFMIAESERNDGEGSTLLSGGIWLVAAGVLTGLAALFKQIGVLNLGFFCFYEIVLIWKARMKLLDRRDWLMASIGRVAARLSMIGLGFTIVLAAFILWLKTLGALRDFWANGVVLNMFYIDSVPLGLWIKFMLGRGLGYVFFNAVLWTLAGWAVWRSVRDLQSNRKGAVDGPQSLERARFDQATALWAAVSLVGVIMSGRFYGHYFIPALPALSLLGARGWTSFAGMLRATALRRRAQAALALLSVLFLIGLFRSHHRTVVLAYETVTGTRTSWSNNWGMSKREQEAQVVSDLVRERIRPGEPLYIWGYAHDVFWRTGCRPASRYLTPYFIDGRFSDAEAIVPSSGEEFRSAAAANLIDDLRRSQPRLILDVEGGFTTLPHAELVGFVVENYRYAGNAGLDPSRPFRMLELKEGLESIR